MTFISRVFASALLALAVIAPVSGTSTNLALEGSATQACNFDETTGGAPAGIDGVTSGIDSDESGDWLHMAHTCFQNNPYWEVLLADNVAIDTIKIYNRDIFRERLDNTKVQIFDETGTLVSEIDLSVDDRWNQSVIELEINPFVVGKRVKLQRTGEDYLNIWELQVFGCYGTSACPTASPTVSPTVSPTKAPTASPTASPTSSPAPPGSFEIHATGDVTGKATSGTTIELLAPYNASNRVHRTTVLSPDCITEFNGTAKEAFQVGDTPDVPLGDGYISYNSTIDVDISKVNTTVWWKALSGGALGGVLDLCLESAIYFTLPDGTNETMNFVNTNLTLTVKMDANFEVTSIDAERKDATKEDVTLNYSQYVKAYQCAAADRETEITGEYSQGDELKICVKSTDPTIVQVGSIKSLVLSQADGPGAGDDFTYITGGLPVDDEIAATRCDDNICHADMQLLGRYFAVDEPGDLTVSGAVELIFGTGRRLTADVPIGGGIRGGDLALENSARRMEDKLPEESAFDSVQVSLKSVDGSGTGGFNGATLLSGVVAAAGGAILMV